MRTLIAAAAHPSAAQPARVRQGRIFDAILCLFVGCRASPAISVLRAARRGQHRRLSRGAAGLAAASGRAPDSSLAVEEIESGRVIGACDLSFIERNVVDSGIHAGHRELGQGLRHGDRAGTGGCGVLRFARGARDLDRRRQQSAPRSACSRKSACAGRRCFASIGAPRTAGGTATCSSCRAKSGRHHAASTAPHDARDRGRAAPHASPCAAPYVLRRPGSRARFVARSSTSSLGMPARPLLRSVSRPPTSIARPRLTMMMMAFRRGMSSTLRGHPDQSLPARRSPPAVRRARTRCRA